MHSDNPYTESQKLVRCKVTNPRGETSVRMVELEHFRLWEHLMVSKHQLQVTEPYLCLWLHEDEFRDNADLYDDANDAAAVNRIVIDMLDANYGFSAPSSRFVLAEECERILEILRSHMPGAQADQAAFEVLRGYVVQQWQQAAPAAATPA